MCYPLFKRNMKVMLKPLLILYAVITMYFLVIIYMFDPDMMKMLDQYQQLMPEMMAAFGMTGVTDTLLKFMNTYLYGFLMMLLPLILLIILGNIFLMSYEDSGSLACLLSTPYSRKKIIITQALSMILSVILLMLLVTITGIIGAQCMFPDELEINAFIILNLMMTLLQLCISGFIFLCACIFQESRNYYLLGLGLPLVSYLLFMLGGMKDSLKWMKKISLYALLPADKIIQGETVLTYGIILGIFIIVFYSAGCIFFTKKDLFL